MVGSCVLAQRFLFVPCRSHVVRRDDCITSARAADDNEDVDADGDAGDDDDDDVARFKLWRVRILCKLAPCLLDLVFGASLIRSWCDDD